MQIEQPSAIIFPPIDDALIKECHIAVMRTRYTALTEFPYYGALGMRLEIVVCNNWHGREVDTAATDGRYLFVNPEYFLGLTERLRLALFIHEVSHVALAHHLRRGRRDQELWNEATDHAVNHLIKDVGLEIGEGWYCNYQFRGWSSERIYGEVKDSPKPPRRGNGNGPPGGTKDPNAKRVVVKQPGEIWDAKDNDGKELTEAGKDKALRELSIDIHMANEAQKSAGNSGSALHRRSVNEIMSPSAGWSNLLNEFWSGSGDPLNETWSRPNRRYIPAGIWAPSVEEGGLNWVVIGVDVSGSIMRRECDAFIAQINELRHEVPARRITIVPFNAVIQQNDIREIYADSEVPNKFNVGGGTNFSSITNWVRRQDEDPDSLIIFTDLCSSRYGEEPNCKVLWASSDPVYESDSYTNRPPFGDVIEIEVPR